MTRPELPQSVTEMLGAADHIVQTDIKNPKNETRVLAMAMIAGLWAIAFEIESLKEKLTP